MSKISHRGYEGPDGRRDEAAVVRAAQVGNQRALDELVAGYLPLIYNIVGRALDTPADTDDVVQEVMLQMIRDVRTLRDPEAFRSWLVAIAMREVRRHWRLRRGAPATDGIEGLEETALLADPGADFVDLTITVLSLSGQRQETAEATRWLDADDRQLVSLWWLEVAGRLTRAELAAAMELPLPQAAVRVQRMKARLEVARAVVRALGAVPRCPDLGTALHGWDGRPDGLWRKRIARHVRTCEACGGVPEDVVPAERLLADLALLPVPPLLLGLLTAGGGAAGGAGTAGQDLATASLHHTVRTGRAAGRAARTAGISAGKTAVLSATTALVLVAGTIAYTLGLFGPGGQDQRPARTVSAPSASAPPTSATEATPPHSATPTPTSKATPAAPAPKTSTKQKTTVTSTELPVRAAFYYPWYSENFTPGGSQYTPSAGEYDIDDPATVDRQIKDMQYGGLQAGISSWWGAGKREDLRLPLLMSEGDRLDFSWTVYYENEAYADPSAATIRKDLEYLRKYSDQDTWLHIDGKPVIFVYGAGGDACDMATRWTQANETQGYYVVLKVFGGYRDCADQPEGWHQYASGLDIQKGYSAILSPGFWKNDAEQPTVPRDLARFRQDAATVAASGEPFQLVVTYNEWGEGTSVESSTDWPSSSGHGAYMDILHEAFAAHPR
ncbi:sigma-70 family RNA polymerase sigma factor [Streptomyces sp. NBC_00564]|uniref:sigma-70 family RNA polymerase sigma factor n=1 Tax=Streptomyces sp. NBC_00564 TaxID=2903663 RepID=UPI002FCDA47E|nr:sigma-70 family RNA polymerase sigma factor [Streptomyces sp. NBC_00564]